MTDQPVTIAATPNIHTIYQLYTTMVLGSCPKCYIYAEIDPKLMCPTYINLFEDLIELSQVQVHVQV